MSVGGSDWCWQETAAALMGVGGICVAFNWHFTQFSKLHEGAELLNCYNECLQGYDKERGGQTWLKGQIHLLGFGSCLTPVIHQAEP